MLLKTGEERERRKMETDRAEGAGLMEVSDQKKVSGSCLSFQLKLILNLLILGID